MAVVYGHALVGVARLEPLYESADELLAAELSVLVGIQRGQLS
jgi:hypothetical protein